MDGRDSAIVLAADAGARLTVSAASWIQPFVGGHYTRTFGYEAYAKDDYSGPSAVVGLELGRFR